LFLKFLKHTKRNPQKVVSKWWPVAILDSLSTIFSFPVMLHPKTTFFHTTKDKFAKQIPLLAIFDFIYVSSMF
jgi:hypothetical protein